MTTKPIFPSPRVAIAVASLIISLFFTLGIAQAETKASQVESPANAFEALLGPYEQVRSSLISDHVEDVAENGQEIVDILAGLEARFTPEHAGVSATGLQATRELLPELKMAAQALANAKDLENARTAFYDLSKPLVRWRKAATTGEKPIVAYCPMSRRSWLQPQGELENPYHGQSMLSCGETVDG